METVTRRIFPLQIFKVGERVVNKDDAIRGRRIVKTIREIRPNGRIQFPRDEREYNPNKFERA